MKRLNTILQERYKNAFIDDKDMRLQYIDQVWDILQRSYASIGGIRGSGFAYKEDMLNLPMWKMAVDGDTVRVVIMYKDKGGRKSVALGTDGSTRAPRYVRELFKQEFKRSYGEKSKAALGSVLKAVPWDALKAFVLTPDEASKQLGKAVVPVASMLDKDIPADGKATLNKFPELRDYAYLRDIGGTMTFKVLLGTTKRKIF
jgi:hypothetical protein